MSKRSHSRAMNYSRCPIDELQVYYHYAVSYGIGTICILGIFLNVFGIFVLRKMTESGQAIYLLTLLSIADTVYLLNIFLDRPLRRLIFQMINGDEVFRRPDFGIFPIWNWLSVASYKSTVNIRNWMVVLSAVVRCLHVLLPFWSRRNVGRKFVNLSIAIIVIVSAGIYIDRYFGGRIIPIKCPEDSSSSSATYLKFEKDKSMDLSSTVIYLIVTVNAPMIILMLANTILLWSISRSIKNRKSMASSTPKTETNANTKATQLVIIATVIYLVCESPTIISRIFNYFVKYEITPTMWKMFVVLNNLTPIDSAINFIIYMIASRSFRKTARTTLFGGK
ncbi:uncharacterized protein LOC141908422 [Tubulanus polymorphus]|uniref:uncharacterized protein LOC141908422 n=1 Tax=Tubulanus polymorphus TaxID=672921 RepID=UPI003DA4AFAC